MTRSPKVALFSLCLAMPMAAGPWLSFAEETAAFLKIGVGARALGMGGAYTAVADDINAMTWNPSGLAALSKTEAGATHAELFAGTRYDFLGFAMPTRLGSWGAGAGYLSQGKLEGRDEAGTPTGSFTASDLALQLAYALKLPDPVSLGASVKYIQSSVAEASARTAALDVGAAFELRRLGPGTPRLGLAVRNLGPGMRFLGETSPLPLTLALGAGYRLPIGVVLAADYSYRPYGKASEVSLGTEYAILPALALRAGYGTARAVNGQAGGSAGLSGLAAGLGLKVGSLSLGYSMTPLGEVGNAQRISLSARW